MGGGPKIDVPEHIWYPDGGPYAQTKHWKSNTNKLMLLGVGVCAFAVYCFKDHEVRSRKPKFWTPSMLFDRNLGKESGLE